MALESAVEQLQDAAKLVGFPIPPSRMEALMRWAQLVAQWRGVADLTALTSPADVVRQLMATALPALSLVTVNADSTVLDYGCGSGCTAVALWAAVGYGDWVLVDRSEKKVAFCRYALGRCRIGGMEVRSARQWERAGGKASVVIARALPKELARADALAHLVASGGSVVRWVTEAPNCGSVRATRAADGPLWVVAEVL